MGTEWELKQKIVARKADNANLRKHNRAPVTGLLDLKQGVESAKNTRISPSARSSKVSVLPNQQKPESQRHER